MLWAIVNSEKIEPKPNSYGKCPLCGGRVLAKCGEVNVWHWAHFKADNCDSWYEPESYWHLLWKMTFGKEHSEVVIKKEGKWHIADILTESDVIIELQNSPIQKDIIRKREEFYGQRMIWVINGMHFKHNFYIRELDNQNFNWKIKHDETQNHKGRKQFIWDYYRKSWFMTMRPVFIDFGYDSLFWVKEGMGTKHGIGLFVPKVDFIKKYGGNYDYYSEQMAKAVRAT